MPSVRKKTSGLRYEVSRDGTHPRANEWRCEAIDTETGDIYVTLFAGAEAARRAYEYAEWQEAQIRSG